VRVFGAWAKLLWNSAVMAAVAAAAQLGVADALGITRWETTGDSVRDWTALLTWIAFCYGVAVPIGALAGRQAFVRRDRRDGAGARLVASLCAAVGAGAVVGLAWLQASGTQPPTQVNPGLVVSLTAGAGVLAGFLLALLALSARPVAAALFASLTWLWLVGIGSAVAGFVTHEPYPAPRLGVLDAPQFAGSAWTNPRLMFVMAVLVGIVVAGIPRWRRAGRLGVALAGFPGPAMVAAAYLIAGPGTGADRSAQSDPYFAALIAVGAGLVASVLIAMPGGREAARRPDLNLDDLRPLSGDVVARPGRATSQPQYGDGSSRESPFGEDRFDEQPTYAGAVAGTRAAETYGSAFPPSERRGDPPGASPASSRPAWAGDTWPGGRSGAAPSGGRHADPREPQPVTHNDGGSTYRGGTYATSGPDGAGAAASPLMGQPPDPHESWLRDLGPSGRHSLDDRKS
jgi:hypothetical protein